LPHDYRPWVAYVAPSARVPRRVHRGILHANGARRLVLALCRYRLDLPVPAAVPDQPPCRSSLEGTMPDNSHSHPTPGLYGVIICILIGLTVATWLIAFVDLGKWNPVVALTIAVIKAVLVILFFMHVRYSSKLTKVTVGAGFFWLLIMITLSLSDYLSRSLDLSR